MRRNRNTISDSTKHKTILKETKDAKQKKKDQHKNTNSNYDQ